MKRPLGILWRAAKVLAWLGVFLAGAVGVGLLATWLTVNRHFEGSEVVVPTITGLSLEAAADRLARADLELRVEARRPHETVEPGQVYFQEPRPDARTRRKRQVRAWVSAGPRRFVVPDLREQSGRAALLNLGQAGLSAGEVTRVHSDRAPGNAVLAQEPPPGASVPDDARVNLLLSSGPQRPAWVMPDFAGRTVSEVEMTLSSAGLRLAEVRETIISGVEGGRVATQEPPAGSRVTAETAISLVVARIVEVAPSTFEPGRAPRIFTR